MFNLKPELRASEDVLGEYGATVYMVRDGISSAGSNVRLWLTNQRLILKAGLGSQRTLPLYVIASIREEKIAWHTMVRLEFANGKLEWLTVQNQGQFLDALRAAQAQAPQIPEDSAPAAASSVGANRFGVGLIFVAILAAVALVCICLFLAMFGGLWFVGQTG